MSSISHIHAHATSLRDHPFWFISVSIQKRNAGGVVSLKEKRTTCCGFRIRKDHIVCVVTIGAPIHSRYATIDVCPIVSHHDHDRLLNWVLNIPDIFCCELPSIGHGHPATTVLICLPCSRLGSHCQQREQKIHFAPACRATRHQTAILSPSTCRLANGRGSVRVTNVDRYQLILLINTIRITEHE